jgi:hypothetical protein
MMVRKELDQHTLTSLVERQSSYTILTCNSDRNAIAVVAGVMSKVKLCPPRPGNRGSLIAVPSSPATSCSRISLGWTVTSASQSGFRSRRHAERKLPDGPHHGDGGGREAPHVLKADQENPGGPPSSWEEAWRYLGRPACSWILGLRGQCRHASCYDEIFIA